MEKTRNRNIAVILIAFVMVVTAFCVIPQTADAAVKGYPGIKNMKRTSFDMYYYSSSKGTFKADLYQTNSSGTKKIKYIRTVSFTVNKKCNGEYKWKGTQSFKKATPNTYYTLYPKTKGHNRSITKKTSK